MDKSKYQLPPHCDWIKEEYFYLHGQIEEFDKKALQIKQWSVTIALAGIGTAYWKEVPALLLLAALSAVLFWFLETQWKLFQQAHVSRIKIIERSLRYQGYDLVPLQINKFWERRYRSKYKKLSAIVDVARWRSVWIPHGLIVVTGVVLFVVSPPEKPDSDGADKMAEVALSTSPYVTKTSDNNHSR